MAYHFQNVNWFCFLTTKNLDLLELKPEDLVMRELMQQKQQQEEDSMIGEYEKIEASHNYNMEEEEMDEELDDDEKSAAYEIAFQSPANRGGNGHSEPPFLTMVQ